MPERLHPTVPKMLKALRQLPAGDRLSALLRPEIFSLIGRANVARLRHEAMRTIERAQRHACSASRADAEAAGREPAEVPGMVLSREGVSFGCGPRTRRWTPAIAVEVEDELDALTPFQAMIYRWPSSITGLQFQILEMRQGRRRQRRLSLG